MPSPLTLSITIAVQGGVYRGTRRWGEEQPVDLPDMQLGPDVKLPGAGNGPVRTLGAWCEKLRSLGAGDLDGLGAAGQAAVGQALSAALFAGLTPAQESALNAATGDDAGTRTTVDLVIGLLGNQGLCHALRLPWPTLLWNGKQVCRRGWRLSMSTREKIEGTVEFAAGSKMLVVAPRGSGAERGEVEKHLADLRAAFECNDPASCKTDRFREVRTWRAFREQLGEFEPDAVYCFGHVRLAGDGTPVMVFDGEQGGEELVPVMNLFEPGPQGNRNAVPLVVYLNNCHSNEGGVLGAGVQIARSVPAVIANRTVADRTVAARQAIRFWTALLFEGRSPELAIADVYAGVGQGERSDLPIWLTPVLYRGYREWRSTRKELRARGGWALELDRHAQMARLLSRCLDLIHEPRGKRGLSMVWWGHEEAKVETFHRRIESRLESKMGSACKVLIHPCAPPGPVPAVDAELLWDREFERMVAAAAGAGAEYFGDVRARLGRQVGVAATPTLWVLLMAVRQVERLPPAVLSRLVDWWDKVIQPQGQDSLLPNTVYGVLAVGYELAGDVGELEELGRSIGAVKLPGRRGQRTLCEALEPIGQVSERELIEFFEDWYYEAPMTESQRDHVCSIHRETGGVFGKLVERMRTILMPHDPYE